jgi:hypothetical protein
LEKQLHHAVASSMGYDMSESNGIIYRDFEKLYEAFKEKEEIYERNKVDYKF